MTVDQLLNDGQTVTLESICARSCEVDSEGKGIKKAGIIGNAEAHAYYRKHSTTYQRGLGYQRRKGRSKRVATIPLRIGMDRDVGVLGPREKFTTLVAGEMIYSFVTLSLFSHIVPMFAQEGISSISSVMSSSMMCSNS